MKFRKLVKEDIQGNYEYLYNMTVIKDREVYLNDYDDMGDIERKMQYRHKNSRR